MANPVQIILRGLEFLWTLLIMALVGNVIHDATYGNPSVINYTMFVSVFAMLTLFYLIVVAFKEEFTFHPLLPKILDVLNVLFWFCAAVALAAELGAHSCDNGDYTRSNHITNGSQNTKKRCQEAQASTAFLWFGFACFCVSLFLDFVGGSGANLRGGIRRPQMSQA